MRVKDDVGFEATEGDVDNLLTVCGRGREMCKNGTGRFGKTVPEPPGRDEVQKSRSDWRRDESWHERQPRDEVERINEWEVARLTQHNIEVGVAHEQEIATAETDHGVEAAAADDEVGSEPTVDRVVASTAVEVVEQAE
jgi:hypothetical protein